MDDYIKREDALNAIRQRRKGYEEKAFTDIGIGFVENRLFSDASLGCQAAEEEIKFLPSADAVEVLYCKDCIYYSEDKCLRWADGTRMRGNDYCSRGVRAE